jgi:hypothetical protein
LAIGELPGQTHAIQNTLSARQFTGFARRFPGPRGINNFVDDNFRIAWS